MASQDALINILEEKYKLLQKSQINLKKCSKQRLTKGYIESRLSCINEYWNSFKNTHEDLVKITPREKRSDISYFVNQDFYICEDLYLNMSADLKDMLYTMTSRKSEIMQGQGTIQSIPGDSSHQVILPKIQLPKFCGNYEEWPTFQDLFISLVHNNLTLSNVQKLHYLKTSVGDEAAALLRHIQITEVNYEQAWSILKDRYGNKKLIVNSLIKRLFYQKKILTPTAVHIKGLLDTTTECLNSLSNQQIVVDSWDPMIIFLIVQKLDPESHKDWERYSYRENSCELPTWTDLRRFLESKFRTLELTSPSTSTRDKTIKERAFHVSKPTSYVKICVMCKEAHTLCHCKEFVKMQPTERSEYVKNNNLCYNCLVSGHTVTKCRVLISCRVCNKRHHSLLHQYKVMKQSSDFQTRRNEPDHETNKIELSTHYTVKTCTALLSTALIPVKDRHGRITILRALIDQGSQASFITKRAAQLLRLEGTPVRGTITGVGSTETTINQVVYLEVLSRHDSEFNLKIKAYVMSSQLTKDLPTKTFQLHAWPHIQGLPLADPRFNDSRRIDMLLGVEVCAEILKSDIIKGPPGSPCALNTKLGWILFGNIAQHKSSEEIIVTHHDLDLDTMLKQMWELEPAFKREYTKEEKLCEDIYKSTISRTNEGRYKVKLPMIPEKPLSVEGETRDIAMKRLKLLEKRFIRNPNLKIEYSQVINDYIEKNHMEEVPINEINKPSVYLPHHPVIRQDKETTKVRVVFDASCKGTNNISINDELLVGPQLQEDMRNLIMRWRLKRICYIADIQQMYRQILVTQQDADYQRLLWREHANEPVKDYRLLRVTFGTSCAPYLAVRTLQQVAEDEGSYNTEAANVIKNDFFMDDLMSGEDTLLKAIETAKAIQYILNKGGFKLQKWASNSVEFLNEFQPSERSSYVNINIKVDGLIKALGLTWNMGRDLFQYRYQLPKVSETITKRIILAEIQRLFDPLGWLAPAIIPAKIIIQKLWLTGTGWDEDVVPEIKKEWLKIRKSYEYLNNTYLNRWLHTSQNLLDGVSLHGFCDASEKAYGAVAYLRVRTENGKYKTGIIAAKGRVAPTKTLSLPRLELCSAYILSTLLKQIKEAIGINRNQIFAWTDSTVVLSWLQGDPARWKTFVRNRVINILDNIGNKWFHVKSLDNPADLVSRGMLLQELNTCKLWWKGPKWLAEDEITYNVPENINTIVEKKIVKYDIENNLKINNTQEDKDIRLIHCFENCDSLLELLRIITYCKRFINSKKIIIKNTTPLPISKAELDEALITSIKIIQRNTFSEEIERLKSSKNLKKSSKIRSLNPYIDANNILRVGGRLKHANIIEDQRHPIILDSKNSLVKLIVAQAHSATLHGGVLLMLNYIRSKYWIIKVKNLVKAYIHNCLICARHSAITRNQLMGNLPKERVNPSRAFLNSGVDFSGPYKTLMSKGRGLKTFKGYIAIFICLATKAVHLEFVGDMSTEAFISAFKRFVARRGKCSNMWSDQGRNFVGANKELIREWEQAKLQFNGTILEKLAAEGTTWHFIPAYSPHFGGLWEAGVKSIKHHLKRILNTNLTFEEMTTVLCEIEACLNSRPLCPIDDTDIDNIDVLTPGHFLIGEAPINVPSSSLKDVKINLLSRWQHTQKLVEDFWHRWQQEYLSRLQQRPKWLKEERDIDIGSVVIIKEDNLPPGKWRLGRIIEKHPGNDNITRVYSVKSGPNIVKRSRTKLCILPVKIESESE